MLVTCPNCAADYNVPDNLLRSGPRKLRCAKCTTMFPSHEVGAVEPPHTPPILRAPMPEEKSLPSTPLPAPPAAVLQIAAVITAWVLSLGAAGALSWEVIDQRAAVMQAWAPSQRAYLALGLVTKPSPSAVAGAVRTAEPEAPTTSPKASHPG
jgi:predicted Zn finger-like uncharacterized protein